MAKICPKCGCGGLNMIGEICPRCGTKLEDIPYSELVRKKPTLALLPVGIVLFIISFIWAGVSRSVVSVAFFFIMLLLLLSGSFYVSRKRKHVDPEMKMKMEMKTKKWKMFSYYGAGIFMGIIGVGLLLYTITRVEVIFALSLTAPTIIFGIVFLAFAERLRRKLKKR